MKKKTILPYNPQLKELARKLRNDSTLAEILLWKRLKGKQIKEYDFDRQKPIDQFIVDFFCHDLMLAIEIDGNSHQEEMKEDEIRQLRMESLGVHFLPFEDQEVKRDVNTVLRVIEDWIEEWEEGQQR